MIFFCRGLFDVSGLNHKHFLAEVCWEFSEFEISCSTSPPGGNQVDGLPPARHMGLGELAFVGVWRLSVILHEKCFFWRLLDRVLN